VQLGEGELGRAIDGDEEIEAPLLGAHLGDVHVEVADGYTLKRERGGLSPPTSGSRAIPWRRKQRWRLARVRRGIVGCSA
jgi:hypothetical protein